MLIFKNCKYMPVFSDKKFQIDSLDKKILSYLTKNARIPFLEIARNCNISGAAVHQRVKRLERIGVIKGSEFIVSPEKMGYSSCVYMGIFLAKANLYEQAVKKLEAIPEITECHYTTGTYSIFIKVYAQNNSHLKEILTEKLQKIPGIMRTETFISLEERFSRQLGIEK